MPKTKSTRNSTTKRSKTTAKKQRTKSKNESPPPVEPTPEATPAANTMEELQPEPVNQVSVELESPPVVETVVSEEESNTVELSPTETALQEIMSMHKVMLQKHRLLTLSLKNVYKAHKKECKNLQKAKKQKKRVKRTPSGFAKPTVIADSLCDFLGIKRGQKIARTDVTKKVTQYIHKHKLQVPENRRQFLPDAKLQSILSPLDAKTKDKNGKTDAEKGYTYFNLQKYISSQFPKQSTTTA